MVEYRSGKSNAAADALSRVQYLEPQDPNSDQILIPTTNQTTQKKSNYPKPSHQHFTSSMDRRVEEGLPLGPHVAAVDKPLPSWRLGLNSLPTLK